MTASAEPTDLAAAVRAIAARDRLLVGLDFDGVLAPIVPRREDARPLPGSMTAVRRLAALDGIQVALVSGRALDSLRATAGVSNEDVLTLVGSHGAEWAGPAGRADDATDDPAALGDAERELLDRVIDALQQIAGPDGDSDGLEVELKPTGAVLHTRRATADRAERATAEALAGPGSWPGVHVTHGKQVVELAVVETSKGVALQRLRTMLAADAVLYIGDDVTDETAFAVLGPADVGVKVGPGETHATYRIDGPEDVRGLLQLLVAERSQR